MAEEKKKAEFKKAEITQVTTQTALAFKLENDEIVSEPELMLRIYNNILKIKEAVA